jgi:CubicO group peptidase (beta-lactamase class C family)
MTTGHRTDTLTEAWALEPADLVKGFLRVPPEDPAGTRHAYNNPTSFVLARMVERVTGHSLPELLGNRLFVPMGVQHAEWDRVASGATFGFHGLHLTTEAVASAAASALPHGTSIAINPIAGGWRVHIGAGETMIDLEVGHNSWRESSPLGRPVVATGAWQGAVYVADLYVITGPHRVHLVVHAGKAVATWNIAPLVGPDLLRQLRSPLMTRPDVA